jgi:uncharacterized protein YcbK (DUF882 family)
MTWNRRQVLKLSALAGVPAAGLLASGALSRAATVVQGATGAKRIALINLHTGERLDTEFFRDGGYLPDALSAIDVLLRDFRSGERHVIDPKLMDYLVDVAHAVGTEPSFSVISGYRSPETNAGLRAKSTGVAQQSLHMQGRAIDVRMAHVDCATLAARAEDLQRGGVGYYRGSDFVHLDTGAFRTWRG